MPNHHGSFVWYELMTSDAKAAEAFYRDVVGWGAQDSGVPGVDYTLLTAGAIPVAGLMTLPPAAAAMGARPGWTGYIAVDSVDAAAAKVSELGGAVHKPPSDIPTVGRFAIVADPHGAIFALFKAQDDRDPPSAAPGAVGHIGWRELFAGDREADFAFYAKMFGWTKGEAMDLGPTGTYQIILHDGAMMGGMMTKPAQAPRPYWNYYVNVDSVAAAIERVKRGSGQVVMGPMQVPGGSWIAQGLDPQMAMFALTSAGA